MLNIQIIYQSHQINFSVDFRSCLSAQELLNQRKKDKIQEKRVNKSILHFKELLLLHSLIEINKFFSESGKSKKII